MKANNPDAPSPVRPQRPWQPIETAPENEVVNTKIDDGKARNEQNLIRFGGLWFFPDKSMYVYYTPTHWRPPNAK